VEAYLPCATCHLKNPTVVWMHVRCRSLYSCMAVPTHIRVHEECDLLAPTGLGHVFAIVCYLSWIVRITHSSKPDRLVITSQLASTVLHSLHLHLWQQLAWDPLAPPPALLQQASQCALLLQPFICHETCQAHSAESMGSVNSPGILLSTAADVHLQQHAHCNRTEQQHTLQHAGTQARTPVHEELLCMCAGSVCWDGCEGCSALWCWPQWLLQQYRCSS